MHHAPKSRIDNSSRVGTSGKRSFHHPVRSFWRIAMCSELRLTMLLSMLAIGAPILLAANVHAADNCTGHKLLQTPRPELSCRQLNLEVYPSPDGTLRAVVYPADISLDATPDMESRVVIRTSKGATLTSKDYSSPRGFNGYYVVNAKWSPDSKFFVYSMSSSGGHSPWQFPMAVYGRNAVHGSEKDRIVGFSELINGNPTISADFRFTGPHTVVVTTWKQPGSPEDKVPVTVDLQEAFDKLPPSSP
jgi:hypothetical protein